MMITVIGLARNSFFKQKKDWRFSANQILWEVLRKEQVNLTLQLSYL
jgi:hypothetical protein